MPRPELALPSTSRLARAGLLEQAHGQASPPDVLRLAIRDLFPGRIALVSSFGAESAVLLHLAAGIDRHLPVIFGDSRRHFPETLAYRDLLVERLGLTDVRVAAPTPAETALRDPFLALAEQDADACCAFRKVAPMEHALGPFDAWISGRKRSQAATRANLPVFEAEGGRIKVNPLAAWDAARIAAYAAEHDLPAHPLVAAGYASIGCAPCTSPVATGEDARAGRWRDLDKTECGLHRPAHALAAPSTGH